MSKSKGKHGFVAPQPSASFDDRAAAYREASLSSDAWTTDPDNIKASERDLARRTDIEDAAHDALIGTPARSIDQVATKVNALFRRWAGGWAGPQGDLANPATQHAVATWPDTGQICDYRDYGQSLLALYLDLTSLDPRPAQQTGQFGGALAAYHAADRATAGFPDTNNDDALEAGLAAASAAEWEAAERLIKTPATTPAQIAEKVQAVFSLYTNNRHAYLANPATQVRVATSDNDVDAALAQSLLAIYLDLTAQQPDRSTWAGVLARFKAADAAVMAAYERSDDDDACEAEIAEFREAKTALLATRSPDAQALAEKMAVFIEDQYTDAAGETAREPAMLTRMLSEDAEQQWVATIYQDALALSGETGPLVDAQRDDFDAKAWLDDLEARTGLEIINCGTAGKARVAGARDHAHELEAITPIAALPMHRRAMVASYVWSRPARAEETPQAPAPATPEEVRALLLKGYVNTFPEDQRAAVLAKLEAE